MLNWLISWFCIVSHTPKLRIAVANSIQITEIYTSVQGESSFAGLPCTFIRLTGCPLRCRWCDTVYSFQGGKALKINEIMAEVKELGVNLVELTGGEPLAQASVFPLMQELVQQEYDVLIETGGSETIENVPQQVHLIMDIKCPGSGMVERNRFSNLDLLKSSDEIKFVVADAEDFAWAHSLCQKHSLYDRFNVLYSPAFGLVEPKLLVEWMLEVKTPARLNLQQHKYIWSPRAKGV